MAPEGRRRAGRGALPKNVKSMSKEALEATLKKKKECDARALEVVERLLEADVAEEAFLACLPLIQESHFRDVVEERAISALCGYPLCSAPPGPCTAPERRYSINTRLNKVYDITERKNFCSNLCYKSARFVKDQLLTSPLWLRDGEEVPTFTLLPSFASGGPAGEEVDIGKVPSLKEEVEKLKRDRGGKSLGKKAGQRLVVEEEGERKGVEPAVESGREADRLSPGNSALAKSENVSVVPDLRSGSAATESIPNEADGSSAVTTSEEVTHEAVGPVGLLPESVAADRVNGQAGEKSALSASGEVANGKATVETIENEMKEVRQVSQLVQTWEGEVHVRGSRSSVCQSDILVTAETTVRLSTKPRPKEGESKVPVAPTKSSVARVEACLEEWVTVESLVLLLGEDAVREAVTGTDLKELLLKSEGGNAWDAPARETYRNICRRLNLIELEDARYDTAVAREGRELRPLPDYAAVREESLRIQLKVGAFFGGRTGYEVPPPAEGEGGGVEEEGTCYLPLVDRHAKGALRRRMVLDRLSRVIPGLMQLLRLSCQDVTSDLRTVVSTFALEAHNITFKPPEWNLLGLVLLKMISLKNSEIGSALESETARGHAAGILAVFGQREGYLDGLVAQLVDVKKVLGKRARLSGGGDG